MITGCAGGMLRDILCNDIPLLLRKELYASVSVLTGALFLGAQHFGLNLNLSMIGAMVVGLAFRMLALHYNRSEEHTSELQSLMRISYAVFCLKKKKRHTDENH